MLNSQEIKVNKIIAILRKVDPSDVVSIVQALRIGGIKIFEITLDSPKALEIIAQLSKEQKEDVLIGAGTVLNPVSAELAIQHGAKFIVSPTFDSKTIEKTKEYGILSVPGCLTPTEIYNAYENGADMVKVFPANAVGKEYFENLSGPLSHIPLIATGGVNLQNMETYLKAGVSMVGLGSSLIPKRITDTSELEALTKKAEEIVRKASQF